MSLSMRARRELTHQVTLRVIGKVISWHRCKTTNLDENSAIWRLHSGELRFFSVQLGKESARTKEK